MSSDQDFLPSKVKDKTSSEQDFSCLNKPVKPFSCISRNDGSENSREIVVSLRDPVLGTWDLTLGNWDPTLGTWKPTLGTCDPTLGTYYPTLGT